MCLKGAPCFLVLAAEEASRRTLLCSCSGSTMSEKSRFTCNQGEMHSKGGGIRLGGVDVWKQQCVRSLLDLTLFTEPA